MTKLDELLRDAQGLEARAAQERQAAVAAQCEAARAAIAVAFGDLWGEIAPYCGDGDHWPAGCRDDVTSWWTVVRAPGLAMFSAVATFSYGKLNGDCYLVPADSPQSGWPRTGFKELPEFLLDRKRAAEQAAVEARAKQIAEARQKFDNNYWHRAHDPEAADTALAELVALDPASREQWLALRAAWQRDYDKAAAERREEQEREEHRAATVAEYTAAFSAFWAEYQRVLAVNEGRLDAYQAELDKPFVAYELTYAYCAGDEDGNQFAATDTAWSLGDEPNSDGYWPIVKGGSYDRKRFYNLVSISAPFEMRPTDRKVYASLYLDAPPRPGWFTLYFHPAADRGEIACQAAALLDPWPAWPVAPDELDRYDVSRIQSRITGDVGYDTPF